MKIPRSLDSRYFLILIVVGLALTDIAVVLNVPVLRQVMGFTILTFLPGWLTLRILKQDRLGLVETIVLSEGISVAFLMLFGLMLNSASLAVGFDQPLSEVSLVTTFSIAIIVLAVVTHIRNRNNRVSFPHVSLTIRDKAVLVVPSFFPLLSMVGASLMNANSNNVLLMLLLLLIPAYTIFLALYRAKVSSSVYPCVIFLVSISLTLMLTLRSNHIIGSDSHLAYYIFQTTQANLSFSTTGTSLVEVCLSISILPVFYSTFLGLRSELLFMVLPSVLFAISPLVVYVIARKYIGGFYAFIAAFFFMAQVSFLWTTGLAQTNTAILFFALAVMVMFHDDVGGFAKKLLFIVFAAASIVSHYSAAYIFFFLILITWAGSQVIRWIVGKFKLSAAKSRGIEDQSGEAVVGTAPSRIRMAMTISMVVLFFAMLFFWYGQAAEVPFNYGVTVVYRTFANLNRAMVAETKGSTITAALGENVSTAPQQIRLVFSWLTVSLVGVGVLSTLARFRNMIAIPSRGEKKATSIFSKMEIDYFALSLACSVLMVSMVILPLVSAYYSTERLYFQTLPVLSGFFVLGGALVANWIRARPAVVLLLALIPFFLSTTGVVNHLFGTPAPMNLSSSGPEYERYYTYDEESASAGWLKENGEESADVYTLARAVWESRLLVSQAYVKESRIRLLVPLYKEDETISGYIYLRYKDVMLARATTDLAHIFVSQSRIYTNNGSEIYR